MTKRPVLTVLLPWSFERVAKTVQAKSKDNDRVNLRADRQGMRITATVQDFLRLGIARVSRDLSDPVVGQLRTSNIPVGDSRTVRLPGGVSVVEVSTKSGEVTARKIAQMMSERSAADVVTIYDRRGVGHTEASAGLGSKGAAVVGESPWGKPEGSRPAARVAADSGKHTGLVDAIRNVWETNGDDFAMLLDWDQSEYETPDIQDLIRSVLLEYLTDDQRDEWNGMDSEQQTKVMEQALPRNAIRETAETLNRHFENITRGAARTTPKTLQACADPMDLGLKDPENLVRVNRRGSINDIFS